MLSRTLFKAGEFFTLWIGSSPLVVRNSYLYLNKNDNTATTFISSGTAGTSNIVLITENYDVVTTFSDDVGVVPYTSFNSTSSPKPENAMFIVDADLTAGNEFYLNHFISKKKLTAQTGSSGYRSIVLSSTSGKGALFSYKISSGSGFSQGSINSPSTTSTASTTSSYPYYSSSSSYSYHNDHYGTDLTGEINNTIQLGVGVICGFVVLFILQCVGICCLSKTFLSKMKPIISDNQANHLPITGNQMFTSNNQLPSQIPPIAEVMVPIVNPNPQQTTLVLVTQDKTSLPPTTLPPIPSYNPNVQQNYMDPSAMPNYMNSNMAPGFPNPNQMNPIMMPPLYQNSNVYLNPPPKQQFVGETNKNRNYFDLGTLFKYSFTLFLLGLASLITKGLNKSWCRKRDQVFFVPEVTDGIIAFDVFLLIYFLVFTSLACIKGISKMILKIFVGVFFVILVIRFGLGVGYIKQSYDLIYFWRSDPFMTVQELIVFRSLIASFIYEDEIIFQCLIFLILTIVFLARVLRN